MNRHAPAALPSLAVLGLRTLLVAAVVMLLGACASGDVARSLHGADRPEVEAAGSGAPTVTNLHAFIESYGYEPGASFARLRIPRLGIDTRVGPKVVGSGAGVMPNPDGPADLVWYDMSAWSGLGGEPGAGGNAIFGGHVDYSGFVPYAGVNYRGVGAFKDLKALAPGDIVEIEYQGETLSYAVVWSRQLDARNADWGAVWSNDVSVDSITLYTCSGAFDAVSRSYQDRVVVRAERI